MTVRSPQVESFLDGRVVLHCGDCLEVLSALEENSIDSCVTDPPYHLTSIVNRFGKPESAPLKVSEFFQENGKSKGSSPYKRPSAGFMGKQWDGGDIAFRPEVWRKVLRVLKPGAHLLAFGGTRTYHRMVCAIEDAGFEIRDSIQWLYGSGFPKSYDVSKGIDRAAGAEREVVRPSTRHGGGIVGNGSSYELPPDSHDVTAPATAAARQWEGWGTALKPACEPIVLARKPLSEKTVAANVLRWGTGAINVGACRVETDGEDRAARYNGKPPGGGETVVFAANKQTKVWNSPTGRWPANVIHDGSAEVVAAFPDADGGHWPDCTRSGGGGVGTGTSIFHAPGPKDNNEGSAARFFYSAKADSDDRLGSKHPTVKPIDLMQYLVRLITPPKGTCLDLFAGTGTAGEAAFREGLNAVLIEREPEYQNDIRRRMKLAVSGVSERRSASAKARHQDKPSDHGPLFAVAGTSQEIIDVAISKIGEGLFHCDACKMVRHISEAKDGCCPECGQVMPSVAAKNLARVLIAPFSDE